MLVIRVFLEIPRVSRSGFYSTFQELNRLLTDFHNVRGGGSPLAADHHTTGQKTRFPGKNLIIRGA